MPAFAVAAAAAGAVRLRRSAFSQRAACGAPAARRRARVARAARMATDEAETEAEAEVEAPLPPEPYPGFYADMKRSGLSDDQARAQARKAEVQANPSLRGGGGKVGGAGSLTGADGKALAPWMNVSADYDRSVIKRKGDAKGRLAGDPQYQELSGQGVRCKMLGDELELTWATGAEEGNRGFIVTRRKGKTDMWEGVSDWKDKPAELASKGPSGAVYSFIVTDPEPGAWIYRISDEDSNGKVSDLSQTLVDVDSGTDASTRNIALAVLLAVIFGFVAFSFVVDPMNGTS